LAVTRRQLEAAGYTVLCAASPTEAQALFALHEPDIDLLLTDVVMPGYSGRVLYERLVSRKPSLKVLYMSGYTDVMFHRIWDKWVAS